MSQVNIYNLEGEIAGTVELDDKIFSETAKPELIYQVVRVMQARARQVLAHTKDRSEVRGGGKKPWRQKGTGRARHGSIRSPIWRGGGVTFGPTKERVFSLTIPRKMAKRALRAVLADKIRENQFIVCESIVFTEPSTKKMAHFLNKLHLGSRKILFLSDKDSAASALSARNLTNVKVIRVENINVLDLMAHDSILLCRDSLSALSAQLQS